jgi:hypothetical protein
MKHLGSLLIIVIVVICLCFVLNTNVRETFFNQPALRNPPRYHFNELNTLLDDYYDDIKTRTVGITDPPVAFTDSGNALTGQSLIEQLRIITGNLETAMTNDREPPTLLLDDSNLEVYKIDESTNPPEEVQMFEINTEMRDAFESFLEGITEGYVKPYDFIYKSDGTFQFDSSIIYTIYMVTAVRIFYDPEMNSDLDQYKIGGSSPTSASSGGSSATSASSGGEVNPFEDKFNQTIDIINRNSNFRGQLTNPEGNNVLQFRESETERLSDQDIVNAIRTISNRLETLDPPITLPDIESIYGNSIIDQRMKTDINSIINSISDNYFVPEIFLPENNNNYQIDTPMDHINKQKFLAFMLFYDVGLPGDNPPVSPFNSSLNMYQKQGSSGVGDGGVGDGGVGDGGVGDGGQSCDTNKLNNLIDTLDDQGNKIDNIYSSLFPTTAST